MLTKFKAWLKIKLVSQLSLYHIKYKNKFCGLSNLSVIDNFVDIGANSGGFSKKIPRILGVEIRNLILVEPDKRYQKCLNNLSVRGMRNKNYQACCISNIEGEEVFNIYEQGEVNSLLSTDKFGKLLSCNRVTSIAGDTLLHQDPHFDSSGTNILKIDVQGAETVVLSSFAKTLSYFDFIILEITFVPLYEDQSEFLDIITILDQTHSYAGNLSEVYNETGTIDYFNAVFQLKSTPITKG